MDIILTLFDLCFESNNFGSDLLLDMLILNMKVLTCNHNVSDIKNIPFQKSFCRESAQQIFFVDYLILHLSYLY